MFAEQEGAGPALFARVVFAAEALCLAPLRDSCEGFYLMSHLRTTAWPGKTALCHSWLLHSGKDSSG